SRLRRSTRFGGLLASSCSSVRSIAVPLGALQELAPHETAIDEKTIVLMKLARFNEVEASMIPNSGPSRPAEAGRAEESCGKYEKTVFGEKTVCAMDCVCGWM